MTNRVGTLKHALAAVGLGLLASATAQAADVKYPTQTVRIVVPYVAGGIADTTARILREFLVKKWGDSVIVDNRPGGATVTATAYVANSEPNGHTMLLTATPFLVNPSLQAKLPFDTERDFRGVSMVVGQSVAMVAHPSVKADNLGEFIAEAKKRETPFGFGSSGIGGISHLVGEMFAEQAGIQMTHIPYRGGAAGIVDVVGGHIPVHFDAGFASKPHVDAGRLKVLGITAPKRAPNMPNVPTFNETLPGFEAQSISSLVVPANTPSDVIEKISADIQSVVRSPEFAEQVGKVGLEAIASMPGELDMYNRAEIAKWAKVIKAANIQAQSKN